jgi:TPR-GreAB-C-PIN type conflict system protein
MASGNKPPDSRSHTQHLTIPPRSFTDDTLLVLQAADDLGADEVVLGYCEKLRSNGVYAPEVAAREIELLTHYNELRKAQATIEEYLDANPANLSLQLALLHVAAIKGWSAVTDAYVTSVPPSNEIKTAADGARLVQILHFKGMVETAVEIAYELVRRFPDDPNSHRVLITSILGLGGPKGNLKLGAPAEVQVGSAVRILRAGQEASEWIVIEDSEKPEISRDEYPPNHPLAKALIGKKREESITFPGFAGEQTAVVEEIKNKILFRMHDSMEKINRRFPEHSFFRAVPIKIAEEGSATGHELDELIELQKKIMAGPREAERFYDDRRFPVAALAEVAHKEIPMVMESLARDERHAVFCVDGRAEEYQRARIVLSAARAVVLDLSALATISLLEADFDLSRMAARCIVSEGSLECLRQLGESVAEDERVSGYMGLEGERLIMQELNPEREDARAARATEFVSRIEFLCEIVGGRALAGIDPKRRDVMIRVLGAETAESAAIAKEYGCPMWTDDYVTGILITREFSLQRVWTQAVCLWLRDAESMSNDECDAASARLCGFNYQFTALSPSTILVACRLSNWDPDKQPLLGVLDRFGEQVAGNDMLVFTAGLFPSLWREAPLDSASGVTIRILAKLSQSSRGLVVILNILKRLDDLFGLNVVGAQRAKTVIEAWLRTTKGGRIIES